MARNNQPAGAEDQPADAGDPTERVDAADDATEPESKSSKGERYIRYIGNSDAREISAADWRQAGVVHSEAKTVRWDSSNGKIIPESDLDFLSGAEMENLIRSDTDFQFMVSE